MKLDDLIASGAEPRVHGNGFIQVDIDPKRRLHVWHPDVPRRRVPTPIHDHVFSFNSYVFQGRLLNVQWDVTYCYWQDRTYGVYEPRQAEGHDTKLVSTGQGVRLFQFESALVGAVGPDTYFMSAGKFHESVPLSPCATIMTKFAKTMKEGGGTPRVLVPRGMEPDNDFNRHTFAADRLWDIVGRVTGDIIPHD